MSAKGVVALLSLLLTLAPGCKSAGMSTESPSNSTANVRPETSPQPAEAKNGIDACKLLTSADIEAVQSEPFKEAKGSMQSGAQWSVSQCFYATANFANSISLTLTQKSPDSTNSAGIEEFWREKFQGVGGRDRDREHERERDKEKKRDKREEREAEESQPLLHVAGIGDDAYWEGDKRVGALYVLSGDRFLRISIGGPDEQDLKISKLKRLATEALKKL